MTDGYVILLHLVHSPCSLITLSLSRSSPQDVVDLISSSLLLASCLLFLRLGELFWFLPPLPLLFTFLALWGLGGRGRTQSDGSEDRESACNIVISLRDLNKKWKILILHHCTHIIYNIKKQCLYNLFYAGHCKLWQYIQIFLMSAKFKLSFSVAFWNKTYFRTALFLYQKLGFQLIWQQFEHIVDHFCLNNDIMTHLADLVWSPSALYPGMPGTVSLFDMFVELLSWLEFRSLLSTITATQSKIIFNNWSVYIATVPTLNNHKLNKKVFERLESR